MKRLTPDDFWLRVDKTDSDACWNWKNYCNKSGYGCLKYQGKVCLAHRVAAYLTGKLSTIAAPKDLTSNQFILHTCDNPACCNPAHLNVGSYSQNQKEAYERGLRQQPKGADHANAKQSWGNVSEIRRLHALGTPQQDLANRFNTSQNAIHNIVKHKTYSP